MIKITLVGKQEVIDRFANMRTRAVDIVFQTLKAESIKLVRYIQKNKLQESPLHHRSGRLQGSIKQQVTKNQYGASARVFTNVEYAAVHEYGFNGQVNVKQHLRNITEAFGKQLKEGRTVTVKAHQRHMVMPERSFMRSALAENKQAITDAIQNSLSKVFST